MNKNQLIQAHFHEAVAVLKQFIENPDNFRAIENAGDLLTLTFKNGNKVISCGNGGSMCDAMHFAEELSGRFRNDRASLPAMSISDPSFITCTGNDYGFDHIFSRYVEGFGKSGDVLLAISTSGNSSNVLKAAETARSKGMKVIALTGKDGGKLTSLADLEIRAPHSTFADRTQEIHIKIIHSLIDYIEQNLFTP
jgi:D-sedoheptulose 7-phosphate isomerase